MQKTSKIYVAGYWGLLGSALVRNLQTQGYRNLITRTRKELDLTNENRVLKFFLREKPEYVFMAAAKVGLRDGIEKTYKWYLANFKPKSD